MSVMQNKIKDTVMKTVLLTRSRYFPSHIVSAMKNAGGAWNEFFVAWIFPVHEKSFLNSLKEEVKDLKLREMSLPVEFFYNSKKEGYMYGKYAQLVKKSNEQWNTLLVDVEKYEIFQRNRKDAYVRREIFAFSQPPEKQGLSEREYAVEKDFHERYIGILNLGKEIKTLHNELGEMENR